MLRLLPGILFVVLIGLANGQSTRESLPEDYQRALQLIHAFSGSGDQLAVAMQLAEKLSSSHPKGGYSETLRAEALSTWRLSQQGQPAELRAQIIALADQALLLNPKLAQAHVARARALLRASEYDQANKSVDAALELDPTLNGAMFIRAEIFRRTMQLPEAEAWYLKFIAATPDRPRQSNGYYWLAVAYRDAAAREQSQRGSLIARARTAYEKMLELDPDGAWKNVNYAIFLNNDAGDFNAAEKYAQKALSIMEFPMARYHLAIARYQKLVPGMNAMDERALRQAIAQVHESTGVSFEDALKFARSYQTYSGIQARLQSIQVRMR
ncbi:MAG: tetratricopeptide repeat protein [Burkholderiales bacterium]